MRPDPNGRGLSRKAIMTEIDQSLRRLGTDYVDLYQTHRWDYSTPIEETMEALHDVVKAGKARYIGGSSMFAWQFAKALYVSEKNGWTKFVSMQNHYNLIYREEEREMNPSLPRSRHRAHSRGPLWRVGSLRAIAIKRGGKTSRAQTDQYAKDMYYQDDDFAIADRLTQVAKSPPAYPTCKSRWPGYCRNQASRRPSSVRAKCPISKKPSTH